MSGSIHVFARAPRPGHVKTRLLPVLSANGTAALARALLEDTVARARAAEGARVVLALDGDPDGLSALPIDDRVAQRDGDLGQRMERVIIGALTRDEWSIVIGTDAPTVRAGEIARAARLLRDHDAVLGPTEDGGYWAVGLRRCPDGLFDGIRWSSAHALSDTVRRLRVHGLSVALLPTARDLDRPADLQHTRGVLTHRPGLAPRTAAALRALEARGQVLEEAGDPPGVAVVIPTLDEAARIDGLLGDLSETPGISEVVVSDGGSADDTVSRARAHPFTSVIEGPPGRARQLNAGADATTAPVLLFLHADVGLPRDAIAQIRDQLSQAGVVGGAFKTWTVADGRKVRWAPLLHLADLRSRYTSIPYGDQAPFVSRDVFEELGGFRDMPLMEDLEFSLRLRRRGRVARAPGSVRVSGRRFLRRPVYYTLCVNLFPLLYRMGVPPERLARLYGDPR